MIHKCTTNGCYSPFQDKTYGLGMRVMNTCKKGSHIRCTVCQKEYPNPDVIKRKPIVEAKK